MSEDTEGFLYPQVDEKTCVGCGICELSCPVLNQKQGGEPLSIYAAINHSSEIVAKSTSGGIFSFFAEQTLQEGGVVFGARFDSNWDVGHTYCTTLEGLSAFRKSKYVQSKLADTFIKVEEFLKGGRKVLFCGTPCQVSGLLLYLRTAYENLITIDFICHGTPSPKVWRMYKEEMLHKLGGEAGAEVVSVDFRDKKEGWKSYDFVLTVRKADGELVEHRAKSHSDMYMRGFLNNIYLRPCCHNCPSKSLKSSSDFTIADFWGIEKIQPHIESYNGVSLLMINSHKTAFDFSGGLDLHLVDFKSAVSFNPCFNHSPKMPRNRKYFFRKLESGQSISRLIEKSLKFRLL